MIFLKKLNLSLTPITMTSSYNKFEKQFLIRNLHDEERLIDCYCIQGSRNQNRLVQAKRFGPVLEPDRTWTNKKLENLEPGRTRTNNIKKISEQFWRSLDSWLCQRRNVHDRKNDLDFKSCDYRRNMQFDLFIV